MTGRTPPGLRQAEHSPASGLDYFRQVANTCPAAVLEESMLKRPSIQPVPSGVGAETALSARPEPVFANPPPTALPAEPQDAVKDWPAPPARLKAVETVETSEEAVLAGPGTCEDACNTPAPICTAVSPLSFFALSPG